MLVFQASHAIAWIFILQYSLFSKCIVCLLSKISMPCNNSFMFLTNLRAAWTCLYLYLMDYFRWSTYFHFEISIKSAHKHRINFPLVFFMVSFSQAFLEGHFLPVSFIFSSQTLETCWHLKIWVSAYIWTHISKTPLIRFWQWAVGWIVWFPLDVLLLQQLSACAWCVVPVC